MNKSFTEMEGQGNISLYLSYDWKEKQKEKDNIWKDLNNSQLKDNYVYFLLVGRAR